SLASVHEALLKRRMRFGTVVRIQVSAMALSLVASVVAALLGARYWALVIQVGVLEGTRSSVLWVVSAWRPRAFAHRHAGTDGLRAVRAFWGNLSAARVIGWAGDP